MAPSLKKALKAFIECIPASKLENFPSNAGTLFKDNDFRLDLQNVSTGPDSDPFSPIHTLSKTSAQLTSTAYNLQIQANKGSENTSVRKAAPQSVAGVLRAFSSKASAEDVRTAFLASAAEGAIKEI